MGDNPEVRKFSYAEGRTEVIESKVRTEYPDGSVVDSEPQAAVSGHTTLTWASLADMVATTKRPPGTVHRKLTRTVVIEAGPWIEVPQDDQAGEA
jgi:hypothetical protein